MATARKEQQSKLTDHFTVTKKPPQSASHKRTKRTISEDVKVITITENHNGGKSSVVKNDGKYKGCEETVEKDAVSKPYEKISPKLTSEPTKTKVKSTKSDSPPSLVLPDKYKMIDKMFYCVDVAVSMLHNRHEACTFPKIKRAVEKMMSKTFDVTHLAQISTVFPEAYLFAQEKSNEFNKESNWKRGNYQLVLTANIDGETGSKSCQSDAKGLRLMTPSVLIDRRHRFASNLLDILKNHHEVFLRKLKPPVIVEKEKIRSWHSRFNINGVPDVRPSKLPEPPTCLPVVSAKDFLERIGGKHGKKMEDKLKKVVKETETVVNKSEECSKPPPSALRGLPQTLIDRIRAKEVVKMQQDRTATPEERKHRAMISKLPEIVRIIRCFFVIEKQTAICIDKVISKIKDSVRAGLEPNMIKEYILALTTLIPEWMQIITTLTGVFVKIDKNQDINAVIDRLAKHK